MALFLLVVGVLFNAFVGLLVVSKNHDKAARLLFLVSIALIGWEVANFLADIDSGLTLFWNRAAFIGPMLVILLSDFFVMFLHGRRKIGNTWGLIAGTLVIAVACVSPLVVSGVSVRFDAQGVAEGYDPIYGVGYYVFLAWVGFLVAHYIHSLHLALRSTTGVERQQFNIIRLGSVAAVLIAVTTNLVLPNLVGTSMYAKFAPLTSVLFMGALVFAIFKHRLFDIKRVVARTIGYGFSIAIIAMVYGFLVFGSARLLFDLRMSVAVQIVMSVITGAAGLMFFRLQRHFDRLTNRVFYRDAYDAETLFDDLNTILVSSLKLDYVLRKTADLLVRHMHLRFVSFIIEDSDNRIRVIGSDKHGITREIMDDIAAKSQHLRGSTIVSDFLEDEANLPLRHYLDSHKIAVIVPLFSSIRRRRKSIGYMVMGAKQSGSFYNNQDLRVVETVANELVIAIQNALHFEEIQDFNITLQTKVDDATRQLRQANHKLQQLDETKDDFISMASHQLRTPLTSVKGYISMVLEGDAGKLSSSQRKMLQQSYVSSQRMVYLIADLLNVSRLKTGKFVVEPTPTDLTTLLKEEVEQLREAAAVRSISLTLEVPDSFPKLMLDETKTRQVVMNFLDNAIYYTPTGGHITAKLLDKGTTVELQIVDDGIGVPKGEQHHLFSKFYRAKNAQRARPDGTGLGLFMAKKVIMAQGGSVIFDSHEGKGSTFGFSLTKSKLKVAA